MLDKLLNEIDKNYKLTERSAGDYAALKISGMKFTIRCFDAAGLGHVSAMSAAGFFGLMKMDTLIVTPTQRDMPLLSYDRVNAMGKDTLIVELYDTFIDKKPLSSTAAAVESGKSLPAHDAGAHWYDSIKLPESFAKKGGKKDGDAFDALTGRVLSGYLEDSKAVLASDPEEKRKKASVYVNGLLEHGGPSTDVFMKALGKEKTTELFRKLLFGTQV